MPAEEVRFMWVFVFFDLPTGTKAERHAAAKFRNFLKNDGYDMLQWSVYTRVCRGQAQVDKHMDRVTRNLPSAGSIRALSITEQQYARMKTLVGTLKEKEKVANAQLVLL